MPVGSCRTSSCVPVYLDSVASYQIAAARDVTRDVTRRHVATSVCASGADRCAGRDAIPAVGNRRTVNPLKRSGVRWLDFKVFSAIQV